MFNEIRHAIRTLLRTPAFTAIALLTIAVGIGANTAIFSVVNGVLLRPMPFPDPDRLVQVWTATNRESRGSHSSGDFQDLQRTNRSLSAIAGYRNGMFSLAVNGEEPSDFEGNWVTVDFFDLLGVAPAAGRTFTRAQDATPAEPIVVIGHTVWQQLFKGSPDAVGTRIRINGETHTIVGVMPRRTEWPEPSKLWVLATRPVPPSPFDVEGGESDRDIRYFNAIARLKPDVTLEQASDDVRRVSIEIQRQHPATAGDRTIRLAPLHAQLVSDVREALLVLQGAVGLVLLIACANVSSLLVARATSRRRELAVRSALGASRGRLVRQLLIESLILGGAGGLLGLLLASWAVVLLLQVMPSGVPRLSEIGLDRTVAVVTVVASLVTGILFGVLPALQGSRADAGTTLKQESGRTSGARARVRAALVVAEIALTLVLLVGAGLLINSFLRLQRVDSGFKPDQVTLMNLAIPQSRYPKAAAQSELYRRLVEGLSQRPEVQAVGVGFPAPLRGGTASARFFIEGYPSTSREDQPFSNVGSVSGGFFSAVGIPLVAGRIFTDADDREAAGAGIVNVALARKYWPGQNPVGKRLQFDRGDTWMTIVGVVGDVRQLGLDEPPPPILYIPYQQFTLPFTNLAVRSGAPDAAVASLMRAQIANADPLLPPGEISSLQEVIDRSVAQPRFRSWLVGAFALIAVLLAAVGVYGLISYSVAQRTREIGIRIALGAQPRQVLRPIVREGLMLALAGIGIGLVGAFAAARTVSNFLFGVSPGDPATFVTVSLVLLFVALIASYVPSRRALRVDPIAALRAE